MENCMLLSMFWKDRLDKGSLIFRFVGGDVSALQLVRNTNDEYARTVSCCALVRRRF